MTDKRIILITGAARGIGLAAALQLVSRGTHVVIASREVDRALSAASALGCDSIQLDITDPGSIRDAVESLKNRLGRIDVLVNNSAILLDHYGSLLELKPDVLRETLETNLIGTFQLTQAMLPLLRSSSKPRIINVSSGAGQLEGDPQPWAPAYSISKTGLNMLTQQLAAALPEVIVNSMCPGWCRTEMGGHEAPRSADEGADTLVWLALDAPGSLTGKFLKDRAVIPW